MSKTTKKKGSSGRPPAKSFQKKLSPAMLRRLGKNPEDGEGSEPEVEPITSEEVAEIPVAAEPLKRKETVNEQKEASKTEAPEEKKSSPPKKVARVTFGARIHPDLKAKFFKLYRREMGRRDEDFPKGELLEEALTLLFESKDF